MTTVESELKRYRLCRAELERSCDTECAGCAHQMSPAAFAHFAELERLVEGEK